MDDMKRLYLFFFLIEFSFLVFTSSCLLAFFFCLKRVLYSFSCAHYRNFLPTFSFKGCRLLKARSETTTKNAHTAEAAISTCVNLVCMLGHAKR